jgi:hypothetical protein
LAKSAALSDENELTDFDVVETVKKKQENHSSSSSQKRNFPLRTSIRVLGEKCDSQVLYHGVFTMYICQSFLNIRPNPNLLIENILSNCKMNIIPANAKFNAMVDAWTASNKSVPSKLPRVIFEGIVGEDELSSQLTYEVGMKEFLPRYEGLLCNQILIQEENLLRIYTKLLKALNEIRLQNAANFSPVMKFKGKSFNSFIAQVKAKDLMTDIDDVKFED